MTRNVGRWTTDVDDSQRGALERARRGDPCGRPDSRRGAFDRDGTSPSPTADRDAAHGIRSLGATLVVARIRDVARWIGTGQARPLRRIATRRMGSGPWGRPLWSPGFATWRVGSGRDKPVPHGGSRRGAWDPARRGDPCGRPDSRRGALDRDGTSPSPTADRDAAHGIRPVGATLVVARIRDVACWIGTGQARPPRRIATRRMGSAP